VVALLVSKPTRTYRQGESWYETPRIRHLVSRNASATQPATLLVFAIADEGEPIKLPLPDANTAAAVLPHIAGH